MAVKNMGVSIGENRDLLRGACINKVFWHNEHQDGSGSLVASVMVLIPRFKIDCSKMPAGVPAALDGTWHGGFWIDKYICSQPNATPHNPYPDVSQGGAPGIHAARSQAGVPIWDYIQWDEAVLACENRGAIVEGTADSGTTTTLVDAALPATQLNYYNGWRLKITAGTNAGEARKVIGYDPGTKTLTLDRPFSAAIDNTSTYRLTQFHLVTPDEWADVMYWSLQYGTMPHGCNNSYSNATQEEANGDADYPNEKGVPDPTLVWGDNNIWPRILTGTGPATFAHNHHFSGVMDLNGLVWEWIDLKINNGSISEVNGDAAHPAVGKAVPSENGHVAGISSDAELMKLAIPVVGSADANFGQDYYWVTTTDERAALRGGNWGSGANAGVCAWDLSDTPTNSRRGVGFRAALSL